MKKKQKNNDIINFKLFGTIPIIAIIFPPIGFLLLVNFLLRDKLKDEK